MRAAGVLLGVVASCAAAFLAPADAVAKKQPSPPLSVKRIYPKAGAAEVAIDTVAIVSFNRAIWLDTVTPATALLRKATGEVVPTIARVENGGKTLVLAPRASLASSTTYEIVVRPGLLGVVGTKTLKTEKTSRFSTDTRPPQALAIRSVDFGWLYSQMSQGRAFHTATTLPGGRVLLAGGMIDYVNYASGADLFDPPTDAFVASKGALKNPRAYHVALPLAGGALLVGGSDATGALATTEVYDPAGDAFRAGPTLAESRDRVAAVLLKNGAVLVTGGLATVGGRTTYRKSAEILDPGATMFRPTTSAPLAPRAGHALCVLRDGRVLVIGGDSRYVAATAEIFDPASETFTAVSYPDIHRPGLVATAIPNSTSVLLVGGMRTPYVFDPTQSTFTPLNAPTALNRFAPTVSALPDGTLLIAGGLELGGDLVYDSMDLCLPDLGVAAQTDAYFREPRFGHTATTLADGRVLFAGGVGTADAASLPTGEVFYPQ